MIIIFCEERVKRLQSKAQNILKILLSFIKAQKIATKSLAEGNAQILIISIIVINILRIIKMLQFIAVRYLDITYFCNHVCHY
jgi:hypothetical protein